MRSVSFSLELIAVSVLFLTLGGRFSYGANYKAELNQVDHSEFTTDQKGKVKLYITITDEYGQPITSLQQGDFRLREDRKEAEIIEFTGATTAQEMTVALVLDRSDSMSGSKLAMAKQAAETFVQLMKESDSACLIVFDDYVHEMQTLTTDKDQLTFKIRSIRAQGTTALYDAAYTGLNRLAPIRRRKAAIVLTDGINNSGYRTPEEVIQYAREIQASIYTIGLGSGGRRYGGIDEGVLRRMASETGGSYFYAPSADKLGDLYRLISMQLQHGYRISYLSPRPGADGTTRRIDVAVTYDGTTKNARGSYYVPGLVPGGVPVSGMARPSPVLFLSLLGILIVLAFLPGLYRKIFQRPTVPQPILHSSQMSSMRNCPGCGYLLRAGAKFCNRCGEGVCPNCGKAVRPGARFCGYCGAAIG